MFNPKHIIYATIAFLLGGLNLMMGYGIILCYFLFCKGFMLHTYYPTFIEAITLSKKYAELTAEKTIKEHVDDNRFRQYLKENKTFVESRLWFLYQQNKEEYQKQIEGTSSFAFIVFPLILAQYFSLKKLNRYLNKRINK